MLKRLLGLKAWVALTAIFLLLIVMFSLSGKFTEIATGNDDIMRLVQIRDVLAGQSWYDHMQYRMGPEGGTAMHWSRIIDAPIIGLTLFFDLFLPRETAESFAIFLWPILTGMALIVALDLWRKDNPREDLRPFVWGFGCAILLILFVTFYMFHPGRIDHHNVQMGALILAFVALSDPNFKARRFALAGIMTGLSLAIGTEALLFLGVNCAFVALLWAFKGQAVARAVRMFGAGFGLTAVIGFLIDTAPNAYGVISCDALNINYLVLALCGGLGLAILTYISKLDNRVRRFVGLVGLGVIVFAVLLLMSPSCLTNPLGELPQTAQTFWLDNVEEAQPLWSKRGLTNGVFIYFIGFISFAGIISLLRYKRQGFTAGHIYQLALTAVIVLMITYQIRYFVFGVVIGTFLLIPWAAEQFVEGKAKSKDSVAYIFALALSCVSFWHVPSVIMMHFNPDEDKTVVASSNVGVDGVENSDSEEETDICFPDVLEDYLNGRAPTTILAEPNLTSPILLLTDHRALNGNYHRNGVGIDMAVRVFLSTPHEAALTMAKHNMDLVIYCDDRSAYKVYAADGEGNFTDHLIANDLPAAFVKVNQASDDHVSVWRLK
ncbi:MAG: hypothetical protein ABJ275_09770 [Maricaulaceae bacterium]